MKDFIIFLLSGLLMFLNCSDQVVNPQKERYSSTLKGQVLLENQQEHSNTLIYLDGLDRGIASDSSGNFNFTFTDDDTKGVFKIYYFLYDYDIDTARFALYNGKVVNDTLDVDENGSLPLKELNQFILVDGFTDKQQYRIGDPIKFTGRITNLRNVDINLAIYSCFDDLGYVYFYNDHQPGIYFLNSIDPVDLDRFITLFPQNTYSGEREWTIPAVDATFLNSVLPGFYLVSFGFQATELPIPVPEKIVDFFKRDQWAMLHIGSVPPTIHIPAKYKLPTIEIIK